MCFTVSVFSQYKINDIFLKIQILRPLLIAFVILCNWFSKSIQLRTLSCMVISSLSEYPIIINNKILRRVVYKLLTYVCVIR